MVTTFYPPSHFGGDGAFVRGLAQALVRRGHQVEVICDEDTFRTLRPGVAETAEPIDDEGVVVHRMRSRFPAMSVVATHQLGRSIAHGAKIRRLLETGDFDVVHFHNVSLVGGASVLGYGDAIKVYTMHEHWLVCPTHVLFRHRREVCSARQCLRCAMHYRRPPQLWRRTGLMDRMTSKVDRFLSPTQFTADKHREFGFDRPITVLPSFLPDDGVSLAPRPPIGSGASEDGYFLFAGRLESIKGLQDVIPSFGDQAPAELRVAGDGVFAGELRRLAMARQVRFLGRLGRAELMGQMQGALAVILPSLCWEVLPLVALEAFKVGTPIIARNLGPLAEIVDRSKGGLLFDDAEGLEAALVRLAMEPDLRERLGNSALRAFEEEWHESVFFERYFSTLSEVAGMRGREQVRAALV